MDLSKSWQATTLLLCLYGFLKELRPSEPFLTEYLVNPSWSPNITLTQAYQDVYPVWTYSYLSLLVAVFMVTDLLRYKLVIVVEGLFYVATWCLLLWGSGVRTMQVMQVCYGVATSTEIAYYTYIYAKVDSKHFQKVTSFTRVALLLGRFLSGILAQTLTSCGVLDYRQLNFVTLSSVSAATVVACLLPSVDKTQYFFRQYNSNITKASGNEDASAESSSMLESPELVKQSLTGVIQCMKNDFLAAYSSPYVARWSLWWALGMCGNFQVGNYIQPLWETIAPVSEAGQVHIYNGAVEAATTLAGAILSIAFAFIRLNWSLLGEPILFLLSSISGMILVAMAQTQFIWVAYAGYVGFRALYQMLITVASYEVAQNIREDSYGLVFGINTFLALLFQAILTLLAVENVGLNLEPRAQFALYGGFWLLVGALYMLIFIARNIRRGFFTDFSRRWADEGVWLPRPTKSLTPEGREESGDHDRPAAPLGAPEQQ